LWLPRGGVRRRGEVTSNPGDSEGFGTLGIGVGRIESGDEGESGRIAGGGVEVEGEAFEWGE